MFPLVKVTADIGFVLRRARLLERLGSTVAAMRAIIACPDRVGVGHIGEPAVVMISCLCDKALGLTAARRPSMRDPRTEARSSATRGEQSSYNVAMTEGKHRNAI